MVSVASSSLVSKFINLLVMYVLYHRLQVINHPSVKVHKIIHYCFASSPSSWYYPSLGSNSCYPWYRRPLCQNSSSRLYIYYIITSVASSFLPTKPSRLSSASLPPPRAPRQQVAVISSWPSPRSVPSPEPHSSAITGPSAPPGPA